MRDRARFLTAMVMMSAVVSGALADRVIAAEKTLRIGAPLPLTGPLSPEGLKQKNGYDLWAEKVNAAGGIKVGGDRYRVRDRLPRLPVEHAARGAAGREAHH
jgi:branched-chain amino acid transport system substrate-binding protein